MKWMEILKACSQADGVSGRETNAADLACELLRPYCTTVYRDTLGNVIGTLGSTDDDAVHILLDAHMDQVGLIVTDLTEEGFVRAGNVGGLDLRLMPAQNVLLHGKKTISGVVASIPPHLSGGAQKVPEITELLIDTGYPKAELEKLLSVGDVITFDTPFQTLQGDRIASRSLDDRCGMAAILYALEQLKTETLPCKLSVLFSVQEEVGECGASGAAFTLHPDIAIAVDVSFALGHGDDPVKCKKLGGGPMIGISPTLSGQITDQLIQTATQREIPWQPEVMAGTTGTNADQFSVSRGGVRTCTVSIPLRYMHTPAEVIAVSDVEATGMLLAEWIKEGRYAV